MWPPSKALVVGVVVLSLLAVVAGPRPASGQARQATRSAGTGGGATPAEVDAAIARGKAWLYARQGKLHESTWEERAAPDPQGNPWFESGGQWGGLTALSVYALLATGESHTDPRLVKAVEFLKQADINGTYALSLRVQVWSKLPQTPEVKQLIRNDVKRLLATMNPDGDDKGQHDYGAPPKGYSHSRSNYAVLGLWTASECNVEVTANYWKLAADSWIANQDPSGGWSYKAPGRSDHPVTPGMTAAGLATLFIAQDSLTAGGGGKPQDLLKIKQSLDRGLKWLDDNFDKVATSDRFDRDFPYPTIYGIERVGLASGLRYIGDDDWYAKISRWLIGQQMKSGAWHRSNVERGSVVQLTQDTAFALLTLARGRQPIAFAKLDYSPDPARPVGWNARPRDVANVTRYIGRQIEGELNWHILTLRSPLDDWHETAVLYLSGEGKGLASTPLSAEDKAKLKRFVEEGGLLFGVQEGQGKTFADWYRKLGAELFPGREWRELPQDHPLFTSQQFPATAWKSRPGVLGLSNGVRELMILLPQGDPGRTWQGGSFTARPETWQLAANVHQYAAGRDNLRLRGQSHVVRPDEKSAPTRTVKLARLRYGGNWDPEPAGWQRMAAILQNGPKVKLEVEARAPATEPLDGFAIAHLTGTDAVTLDAATLAAVGKFIEGGGVLLVDAAGGAAAFASSVESALNDLFPGTKLEPLPPEHPMLTDDKAKPLPIDYRPYARKVVGNLSGASRLQCLTVNDRAAVIYSREDLSAGIMGGTTDGIIGYAPATAAQLVQRLILSTGK